MNENKGATMDFFGSQEKARRQTSYLVFLFVMAVIMIILCVYLAVSIAIFFIGAKTKMDISQYNPYDLRMFLYIAGGTILLVSLGSFFKIASLGKGGMKVAEMLGGSLVSLDTRNPDERKLLNVVEEMSIAAGIPMPLVYALRNEESVNAFAAGYSPASAVIGVTKGAIERLNRDELQGVIAHEFSHILNGDMRLNIRLIGALHGILLIGITGRVLLELVSRGRWRTRSSSRKKSGGGMVLVILGLGVALLIIGYVGVFFGKLIKAAVSRKREFLADASAVQYTRNPEGLGNALKKIGGWDLGSRLFNPRAEEASHLFFGNALGSGFFTGLFATHPSLDKRIHMIEPSWDGKYLFSKSDKTREKAPLTHTTEQRPMAPFETPYRGKLGKGTIAPGATITMSPDFLMKQVGVLNPMLIAQAGSLLSLLPPELKDSVKNAPGARAVVFALLLNSDPVLGKKQWECLENALDPDSLNQVNPLREKAGTLGLEERLSLLDLATPVFRRFLPEEAEKFLRHVDILIHADDKVSLFEYALTKILRKVLNPIVSGKPDKALIQYYSFNALMEPITLLTSTLAQFGNKTVEEKQKAFDSGMDSMGVPQEKRILEKQEKCAWERLDKALDQLRQAAPIIKKRLMEGLAGCVAADGTITPEEGALLRAIAEVLDCPIPPLTLSREEKS
ncbi:M48 family metallopeptidase [Candidatus Sumerlaeota bacterium]|nr:M48 family metallopeptidase [Candidatus Sumerlaeota bacterium]